MKTKEYVLTEVEIMALRDALTEYWHNVSKQALKRKNSPIAQKMHKAVESLKDQFIIDARAI